MKCVRSISVNSSSPSSICRCILRFAGGMICRSQVVQKIRFLSAVFVQSQAFQLLIKIWLHRIQLQCLANVSSGGCHLSTDYFFWLQNSGRDAVAKKSEIMFGRSQEAVTHEGEMIPKKLQPLLDQQVPFQKIK
ncbi:hypothetical protein L1987_85370 [Smallanthus sonchifolius]|uniref:Uncharacterized protein n=1 Tax=Smallanthus sonchifolius TaxID=185202 RepID=A0ACB8XWA5_9ASTR|nr:hypothetical protein L1987_85370 [Smallanthus sonchifolius]